MTARFFVPYLDLERFKDTEKALVCMRGHMFLQGRRCPPRVVFLLHSRANALDL